MEKHSIDLRFGRQAFGLDPLSYHTVRPAYSNWVYKTLQERCGLAQDTAVFEIGAGTGLATQRLLDLGANPLIAIEPDNRLGDFLRNNVSDTALTVVSSAFEDVILEDNRFDLGFCATAFHWLNEDAALNKVAALLRPGGWWAMVWNVFGDDNRPDPFHEATKSLLDGPLSPSAGVNDLPFALDVESRIAAMNRTQSFDCIQYQMEEWSLTLDTDQTVALYATYSNINIREDRDVVLNELARIARDQFQGRVTRNMITSLYIAQRRP